jgi:tetratricopeptide (TPR) repeat protein
MVAALGLASLMVVTQPRAAAQAQQQGPQWKDQQEYDMYNAVLKETDTKKKLALINAWKEKYPDTQYKQARLQLFLNAYVQLNDFPNVLGVLNELLAMSPTDLGVMSPIMYYTILSNAATPAALDNAEKAANSTLANLDNKPATINADQWPVARKQFEAMAHKTLGWVAMQRKNGEAAKAEFLKSLAIDPNQGEVDYWLGNTLRAVKTPETFSQALFYYARAASYDGQGSLPEAGRTQLDDYFKKAYVTYHGSEEGLAELKAMAKSQAMPPADFKVKTSTEIAAEKEEEFKKSNPQLAMWMSLKKELTGPNGQQFFDGMKGADVPGGAKIGDVSVTEFKGTILAAKPAVRSKELVLAVSDEKTPEVTIKLDAPLSGKPEIGSQVEFDGIASAFSSDPFMVTFDVEKAKLKGLKMSSAPAAPTPKRRPAGKKKG